MKKTLLLSFSLWLFVGFTLNAQTTINLIEKDGTLTTSGLIDVNAITFSNRALLIKKSNGEELSFELSDIQSLAFDTETKIQNQLSEKLEASIYPNPSIVNQTLTLDVKTNSNSPLTLDIYSMSGVKVQSNFFPSSNSQPIHFNVRNISPGIYVAFIQQGSYSSIEKLIIK